MPGTDLDPAASHPTVEQPPIPLWRAKRTLLLYGLLLAAGFYLLTVHTAHVLAAVPFLLVAACPLMHLFMHHGQHGHAGGDKPR